jgi:hypothetical protein
MSSVSVVSVGDGGLMIVGDEGVLVMGLAKNGVLT